MAKSFTKQPSEVLDYDVDMADWFDESDPDDEIDSVTYVVTSATEEDPELEVGPSPHSEVVLIGSPSTRFKVWLGGGTDGVEYLITFLVVTEAARQIEIELKIKVRDR